MELAEFDRAVLLQLDGTRDFRAVLEELVQKVLARDFDLSQQGEPVRDPEVIRAAFAGEVERAVRRLARSAMLVR